jgi:hypothetical protein
MNNNHRHIINDSTMYVYVLVGIIGLITCCSINYDSLDYVHQNFHLQMQIQIRRV